MLVYAQVANTMDQFEKQFENLDIQSEFVENAMNAQASLSTPEDDVNMLVQQVAEEHNLESMLNMPAAGTAKATPAQQADKSDLSSRLAQLHNSQKWSVTLYVLHYSYKFTDVSNK